MMPPSGFNLRSAPKGSPSHVEATSPLVRASHAKGEEGLSKP